eukprot:SAG31_NODE_7746_length_1605_cov_1.472776_1_plen_334_part_01
MLASVALADAVLGLVVFLFWDDLSPSAQSERFWPTEDQLQLSPQNCTATYPTQHGLSKRFIPWQHWKCSGNDCKCQDINCAVLPMSPDWSDPNNEYWTVWKYRNIGDCPICSCVDGKGRMANCGFLWAMDVKVIPGCKVIPEALGANADNHSWQPRVENCRNNICWPWDQCWHYIWHRPFACYDGLQVALVLCGFLIVKTLYTWFIITNRWSRLRTMIEERFQINHDDVTIRLSLLGTRSVLPNMAQIESDFNDVDTPRFTVHEHANAHFTASTPRRWRMFKEQDLPDLKIGKRLGTGSFGDVFEATWMVKGSGPRKVAVKQLRWDGKRDHAAA